MIISMLFGFLSVVAIARFFSRAESGIFSLALTISSVALVVATLGFLSSLPGEVAFYREKESLRISYFNGINNYIFNKFSRHAILSVVLEHKKSTNFYFLAACKTHCGTSPT